MKNNTEMEEANNHRKNIFRFTVNKETHDRAIFHHQTNVFSIIILNAARFWGARPASYAAGALEIGPGFPAGEHGARSALK